MRLLVRRFAVEPSRILKVNARTTMYCEKYGTYNRLITHKKRHLRSFKANRHNYSATDSTRDIKTTLRQISGRPLCMGYSGVGTLSCVPSFISL